MTQTTHETSAVGTRLFTECSWQEISSLVAQAFRMTEEETRRLYEGRIAKLIAAIPFLAGCDDAERTAVAHLGTYLLSIRETKRYFDTRPEDAASVLERLRLGAGFKGGDQRIIERGLCLLALNMVADYQRDLEEDAALGKYNPIAAGAWDFKDTVAELQWKIANIECAEMEEILPLVMVPMSYWSNGVASK